MADDPDPKRMQALEARITAARKSQRGPGRSQMAVKATNASNAWRMVIELVTGMVMGFGIGYGLDWVLGTLPIFLVIFSLLGFAAGVRVMMETAQSAQRMAAKGHGPEEDVNGD